MAIISGTTLDPNSPFYGLIKPDTDDDFSIGDLSASSSEASTVSHASSHAAAALNGIDSGFIEEDVATRTMRLSASISRNLPNASSDFKTHIKSAEFKQLPQIHRRKRLQESLDDRILPKTLSTSISSNPLIDHLDIDDPSKAERSEKKATIFHVIEHHNQYTRAAGCLTYSCSKTHDVVLKFLTGLDAIGPPKAILGQGGCATVTKQAVLDTDSAAKALNDVRSLSKEVRIPLEYPHPNIIGLHLVDEGNGVVYLELASKGSLKAARHLLSREEFLNIAHGIAAGLTHLHDHGFVHGDVKADNVLITEAGVAKISDFGTTVTVEEFDPDNIQGTVFYLPIDYLRGQTPREDCKSIDVWSFGMILWQQLKRNEYITPFTYPNLERLHPTKEELEGKEPEGVCKKRHLGGYNNDMSFISYTTKVFQGFEEGHLERLLDPAKRAKYDPNGTIVALMKSCLAYKPEDRPSMNAVRDILSNTAAAVVFEDMTI